MKKYVLFLMVLPLFRTQAQVEYFVHVDPLTGKHLIVDSIPGIDWIQTGPSWSTVDKVNNVYYFKGGDNIGNWFLLGIDGGTGQVLSKAPITNTIGGFTNIGGVEHDDSTSQLVAFGWNPSQNMEYLLKLDKLLGTVTPISVIPGCKYIQIGENTYDQTNHRYYFKGLDSLNVQRMYVLNTLTGSLVAAPAISNAVGVLNIRYNSATNKLYAFTKNTQGFHLSEIDPLAATPIKTVQAYSNMLGVALFPNYSSINETTNELTFLINNALETTNLSTGITHTNVPFPVGLSSGENVIELRYQNATGTLFGLHWGKVNPTTVGLNEAQANKIMFSAFPNPVVEQMTIHVQSNSSRAALFLYDEKGTLMSSEIIPTNTNYTFHRNELLPGVYVMSCETEDGDRTIQKIVFR